MRNNLIAALVDVPSSVVPGYGCQTAKYTRNVWQRANHEGDLRKACAAEHEYARYVETPIGCIYVHAMATV